MATHFLPLFVLHTVLAVVIFAATEAVSMYVECLWFADACTFAPETSVANAAAFLALILLGSGFLALVPFCGAILLLRRFSFPKWWVALPLSAIAGPVPLLLPCLAGGISCNPVDWFPEMASGLMAAGVSGGMYLWIAIAIKETPRVSSLEGI